MSSSQVIEIIVIATMSAGKSTFINALIGDELLHSANEATTATITKIHTKPDLAGYIGTAYGYTNEVILNDITIDATLLKKLNADNAIKTINIFGKVDALSSTNVPCIIYDTPGPNNSQDSSHEALAMNVIEDGNYGVIIYILNATQIGVNDDKDLLEKVSSVLKKDEHKQIIFILNKVDELDIEKGETLTNVIPRIQNYLKNLGFNNPSIIPTSSHHALIVQKVLSNKSLTRSEHGSLKVALELSNNSCLQNAIIDKETKKQLIKQIGKKSKTTSKQRYLTETFDLTSTALKDLYLFSGMGIVQRILLDYLTQHSNYKDIKPIKNETKPSRAKKTKKGNQNIALEISKNSLMLQMFDNLILTCVYEGK